MESSGIFVVNLSTIFDFSSIAFALLKQLEEDKSKGFDFSDLKLPDFHLKSFKSFSESHSKGDEKRKEELFNFIKTSNLYNSVKPKLYFLAQLKFLIAEKVISPKNLFIYYEEKEFLTFLGEKYLSLFKSKLQIENIVSIEDLIEKEIPKFEKVIVIGEKKFINEKLTQLQNKKVEIIDYTKEKSDDVENSYYNSFENFITKKHSNLLDKFKTYMSSEFIMKYSHDQITKKFEFSDLWHNYFMFPKKIQLDGKVVKGFKRGSKMLGIPTANIEMNKTNSEIIKNLINGVYFGIFTFKTNEKKNAAIEKKKSYKGVLSIGYNPFFDNKTKTIEVFLIDYEGEADFYEDEVSLVMDGYSRSEENFIGLPELVTTITYDIILFNEILEKLHQ